MESRLSQFTEWSVKDATLFREFRFATYLNGIGFVNAVAELAEEANHHPDLLVGWRRVGVALVTHSEGGITELDFAMAKQIDQLVQENGEEDAVTKLPEKP